MTLQRTLARAIEGCNQAAGDTVTPAGLVPVPVGKGCVLILTRTEYLRGLRRGKWWRRQEARKRRANAVQG